MWLIQNYTTVTLSFNPVQNTDGMFPGSLFTEVFFSNDALLYHCCSMCVSIWNNMGRYCDALVKLESKMSGLKSKHVWNDWCGAPLFDRWVSEWCRMPGLSDFSLLPDFPALQPGWGIQREVGFLGDNEGHARKPISLHWLQRKPQVIRLDIDIKFLDGSLSHFKPLEDCSSHLKICT